MKKIIAAVLIGFSIMTCFAACGEKDNISTATVSYLYATQRVNSGEDCWISGDKKEFYVAEGRDENGMPTTVYCYNIVN